MGLLRAGIIIIIIYIIFNMIQKNKKNLNNYYVIKQSGITDKYILHFIILIIILFELII